MIESRDLVNLSLVAGVLLVSGCGSHSKPGSSGDPLLVPDRNPIFTSITAEYGPLKVIPGEFEAQAAQTPWSSWWYPANQKTLFQGDGDLSPLEKYDAYVSKNQGTRSRAAASYERDHLYDPAASPWEGLCNAWSAAAISEPEPTKPIQFGNLVFFPSDQKALLIKSYEQVDGLKQFGQRYDGRRGDAYDDLYPDQFHKLLQTELFEKNRAFVIDKDAGVEVWNVPLYRASISIEADARDAHLLHVDTWVTWADSISVDPDFLGTKAISHEYTYDLYGIRQPDGSYQIKYGEWTGDSLNDHPDFATVVPEHPTHQSLNKELQTDVLTELLKGPPHSLQ